MNNKVKNKSNINFDYSIKEFKATKRITNWMIFGAIAQIIFTAGIALLWLWYPILCIKKLKSSYKDFSKTLVIFIVLLCNPFYALSQWLLWDDINYLYPSNS